MGGGLSNGGGGSITVTKSNIYSNTATKSGGGIDNTGSAKISGCTVSKNYASSGGGIAGGYISISDSTISENTAINNGGGISGGNINIYGATRITNNQALNGYGGGVFCSSVGLYGTSIAVISNKAHLPATLLKKDPWYRQYGLYFSLYLPNTYNGFNPITQVTGNTQI
jgi:predicted outer membrane repeat protein